MDSRESADLPRQRFDAEETGTVALRESLLPTTRSWGRREIRARHLAPRHRFFVSGLSQGVAD